MSDATSVPVARDDPPRPTVSVIIPFFDTPPPFLQEAVDSVVAQSFDAWELILVDDGSTGPSAELARALAATRGPRIRLLEHPGHRNRGLSASRMLGVSHAAGRYVAFLDSDDVWEPFKLTEQVALMEAHPAAGMLYGNTRYWHSWTGRPEDRDRDFVPRLGVPSGDVVQPPRLLPLFLLGDAAVPCTCSILVRREVFDAAGGFEASFRTMYEDQVFYAKVCLSEPVLVSDRCWDRYRQHESSICAVADRRGERTDATATYLRWLEGYLTDRRIDDPSVWRALEAARLRNDDAAATGLRRLVAESRRRIRKWSKRLRRGVERR